MASRCSLMYLYRHLLIAGVLTAGKTNCGRLKNAHLKMYSLPNPQNLWMLPYMAKEKFLPYIQGKKQNMIKLRILRRNAYPGLSVWVLSLSHVRLFATPWTRLLCPWNFPGKNTGVSFLFLLQGIFLTQWSNSSLLCFLHWQVDSLPLCQKGLKCN